MKNTTEKRSFNRLLVTFKISISIEDKKNTNHAAIHAEAVNISAEGVLFHSSENLKPGTNLFLSFYPLNSTDEFIAEARVVRSKKKHDHEFATAAHFKSFMKGDIAELNEVLTGGKNNKALNN
jgi:hypothetical protein